MLQRRVGLTSACFIFDYILNIIGIFALIRNPSCCASHQRRLVIRFMRINSCQYIFLLNCRSDPIIFRLLQLAALVVFIIRNLLK